MDISDKILLQQTISYEYVRSKIFCARVSIKTQEARDDVLSLSLSLSLSVTLSICCLRLCFEWYCQ